MTTFSKIESAQLMGDYKSTKLDELKKSSDFRIMQVNPFYIRWSDGRGQIVSARQLEKLKKSHIWTTDF